MEEQLLEERYRSYLRGLPEVRLRALAARYAQAAAESGLKVLQPDGRSWPIPPSLTPFVEQPDNAQARSQLAHHLLSGVEKTARFFLGGAGRSEAEAIFTGLSRWERQLVAETWHLGGTVALARADFFTDERGVDRPLEMNSTIPAMAGYGDLVAQAFVLAVAQEAGMSPERAQQLVQHNGSNVDDLRLSLLSHLRQLGCESQRVTVAVVARPQDAQSSELAHICQRFIAAGLIAHRCTPDQLAMDERQRPTLMHQPVDLIYRHVFARNVADDLPFARMLRDPLRYRILNPPNSQLEVKAIFAELSEAGDDPARAQALGLDPYEITAAQRIPWSRRLRAGPSTDSDREPIADLVAHAVQRPAELVLKRSWGYGGTSVLLGDEIDSDSGQAKAQAMAGGAEGPGAEQPAQPPLTWAKLLEHCTRQGGFVLQRKVSSTPQTHLVPGPLGPEWTSWYVDVSAFTNLGADPRPSGGVRRGSKQRIVNIVAGGGLVPSIHASVMAALLEAIGV